MDTIPLATTIPPPPVCTAPEVVFCYPGGSCVCVLPLPPPPRACTVTIIYPDVAPSQVQISKSPDGCDAAGVELAVAVALARLLGAPNP